MVNFKVLILASTTILTTVLAQKSDTSTGTCGSGHAVPFRNRLTSEEVLASAMSEVSAILSAHRSLIHKNQVCSGPSLDNHDVFSADAVAPTGFDKLCESLSSVSDNLGHILDRYNSQGMQCSNDARNVINSASDCRSFGGATTSLVSQILRPLAMEALQSTSDKIKAQSHCLHSLLTAGQFLK